MLLPILHYALLDYSAAAADWVTRLAGEPELLSDCDDATFTEVVLRLAPALGVRAHLSAAQFLALGFVERKLLFVVGVIRGVQRLDEEARPVASRTRQPRSASESPSNIERPMPSAPAPSPASQDDDAGDSAARAVNGGDRGRESLGAVAAAGKPRAARLTEQHAQTTGSAAAGGTAVDMSAEVRSSASPPPLSSQSNSRRQPPFPTARRRSGVHQQSQVEVGGEPEPPQQQERDAAPVAAAAAGPPPISLESMITEPAASVLTAMESMAARLVSHMSALELRLGSLEARGNRVIAASAAAAAPPPPAQPDGATASAHPLRPWQIFPTSDDDSAPQEAQGPAALAVAPAAASASPSSPLPSRIPRLRGAGRSPSPMHSRTAGSKLSMATAAAAAMEARNSGGGGSSSSSSSTSSNGSQGVTAAAASSSSATSKLGPAAAIAVHCRKQAADVTLAAVDAAYEAALQQAREAVNTRQAAESVSAPYRSGPSAAEQLSHQPPAGSYDATAAAQPVGNAAAAAMSSGDSGTMGIEPLAAWRRLHPVHLSAQQQEQQQQQGYESAPSSSSSAAPPAPGDSALAPYGYPYSTGVLSNDSSFIATAGGHVPYSRVALALPITATGGAVQAETAAFVDRLRSRFAATDALVARAAARMAAHRR